jgi:hypothetical protein
MSSTAINGQDAGAPKAKNRFLNWLMLGAVLLVVAGLLLTPWNQVSQWHRDRQVQSEADARRAYFEQIEEYKTLTFSEAVARYEIEASRFNGAMAKAGTDATTRLRVQNDRYPRFSSISRAIEAKAGDNWIRVSGERESVYLATKFAASDKARPQLQYLRLSPEGSEQRTTRVDCNYRKASMPDGFDDAEPGTLAYDLMAYACVRSGYLVYETRK